MVENTMVRTCDKCGCFKVNRNCKFFFVSNQKEMAKVIDIMRKESLQTLILTGHIKGKKKQYKNSEEPN